MAGLGQREATIWEQYGLHVERGKEALGARQRDSVPTDLENSDSLEVKGVKKTRFLIAGFCDEELMCWEGQLREFLCEPPEKMTG